jgi:pimeloyl-ACP methyl ester carboxylesterase
MLVRPRGFAWAGLASLLALACEGSAGRRADAGTTPDAGGDAAAPGGTLPLLGCTQTETAPGLSAKCGDLRVPERYEDPAAGTVLVRVASFAPLGPGSEDLPLLYLDGGAGGSSIANAAYYAGWAPDHALKLLMARRRLIAIDLRGSGGSRPMLACEGAGLEPLSVDSETDGVITAVTDCRQALVDARQHLEAFGSAAAARDVEAVIAGFALARYDHLAVG